MYGNTSAGVGVEGVLHSGSFYMCPAVKCILCSENVYTAYCFMQMGMLLSNHVVVK